MQKQRDQTARNWNGLRSRKKPPKADYPTEVLEATITRGRTEVLGGFRMLSIRRRVKENGRWTASEVLVEPDDLPRFVDVIERTLRMLLACAAEDMQSSTTPTPQKGGAECAPTTSPS